LGSLMINPRSPYILLPMTAILNSIKFMVSVPVLSVNTYSICPSYSLREADLTLQYFFLKSLYINLSF
jgi:hypothetical protein